MDTSENWSPRRGRAPGPQRHRVPFENALNLIRELDRYTPRIILLLTKADLLSQGQQDEVVRFFQETLKRELHRDLPIYLFSNRVDTELFQHRLEMEIINPLTRNRDVEFGRILRYKVQSLAKSCRGYWTSPFNLSVRMKMLASGNRFSAKSPTVTQSTRN
jgi:hypothetical protein